MSIALLTDTISFPSPEHAEEDGLLAVGGDLSRERLLKAYSMGIFPWYSEDSPILWWSPDPRLVLFPQELKISRSLRQCIKKGIFSVTMNTAFEQVIRCCAESCRKGQSGTWITDEMMDAYIMLHHSGHAHSVEAWHDGELAGGLYGIIMGRIFFGESMFSKISNASKVAFVTFVEQLKQKGFGLIDCQVKTEHLVSLGAREITRKEFLMALKKTLSPPPSPRKGKQDPAV
ncbi:MAG: leucyl/phenylalanyl-tRNA--protein transferase [Nitrospirae bacterium]|nr:leucyl/phenylalanyl-tRNA--protein transferase [Nitrospirota bacterium]